MTAAGVTALLALAVTVASLGYLHFAPTGLSPVRNAVSQYGITPFRAGYRVATLAAFRLAGVLSREDRWHWLISVSTALGGLMAACLVGMALARTFPAVRARFGAVERGFYLAAIAWFAVFSVACVTGPR